MGKDGDRLGKAGDRLPTSGRDSVTRRGSLFSGHSPRLVTDLRKDELRKLTEIFHTDNTRARHTEELVKQLIHDLPKHMRRDRWFRTNKTLCATHQALNADLVHDLFRLIQREVGQHLLKFEMYPEFLKPLDELILARLRAVRGMWEKPDPTQAGELNAWAYEINQCQGCMLARVASDKDAVRNLRIALLSRTQTRLNHVPRRLLKFVDSCIDLFPEDLVEMYSTSSQFAYILKAARKACTKAWYNDPANKDTRTRRRHKARDKDKPVKEGSNGMGEYDVMQCRPRAPPPILDPHPAERYVEESTSSYVARPYRTDTDNEGRSVRQWNRSGDRSNSSLMRTQSLVEQQEVFHPERVTRLMDFVEGRHDNFHDTVYGPPGNPPSPRIPSAELERPDAVDELIQMYRNMGTNPYRECPPSPSICTTSCEWTDDELENLNEPNSSSAARDTLSLVCDESKAM
jgi:hypothetical protein